MTTKIQPTPASINNMDFFSAGKACFTIRAKDLRFTYRINKVEDSWKPGKHVYFVKFLSGPDNVNSYTYLGMYNPIRHTIRLTKKSRVGEKSDVFRYLAYALALMALNKLPDNVEVWHEGRCGRCNRTLTVPESIERGLGPICAGQVG